MTTWKRRRLSSPELADTLADIQASEIDLDILLRQRIGHALESRITLAETLRSILLDGPNTGAADWQDFRETALQACRAIEEPVQFLLRSPPPHCSLPNSPKFHIESTQRTTRKANPKPKFLYTRPSPSSSTFQVLRCPTCKRMSFSSLQGFMNHSRLAHNVQFSSHDECILSCAVWVEECEGEFHLEDGLQVGSGGGASVRGLKRLFEDAVGVSNMSFSPALAPETVTRSTSPVHSDREPFPSQSKPPPIPAKESSSTQITRTLGHHFDTPALAPFLGRENVQTWRKIHVDDKNVPIDVDSKGGDLVQAGTRWRMPFKHRSESRLVSDITEEICDFTVEPITLTNEVYNTEKGSIAQPAVTNIDIGSGIRSRFHFTARLVVTDHSMWLPSEGTYRWMLCFDSPAYSSHISSFVTAVSISSSEYFLPAVQEVQHGKCTTFPFYLSGRTPAPFLAKVEVLMTGIAEDTEPQKLLVEHWVDVDPLQSDLATVGDEQILDVELDKGTLFKPTTSWEPWEKTKGKPRWHLLDSTEHESEAAATVSGKSGGKSTDRPKTQDNEEHVKVLRDLSIIYPLTMKDYKPNATSMYLRTTRSGHTRRGGSIRVEDIPYKLVASPATFKTMVAGRRKAIEWARAMAIHSEYCSIYADRQEDDDASGATLPPLTIGNVFTWLENRTKVPTNYHSATPVSAVRPISENDGRTMNATQSKARRFKELKWCEVCGFLKELHPKEKKSHKQKRPKVEEGEGIPAETETWTCNLLPTSIHDLSLRRRMPPQDVDLFLFMPTVNLTNSQQDYVPQQQLESKHIVKPALLFQSPSQSHNLVRSVDPQFTLSIARIVSQILPLISTFSRNASVIQSLASTSLQCTATNNLSRFEIEQAIAPYALLALCTRSFIRSMTGIGINTAAEDLKGPILKTHWANIKKKMNGASFQHGVEASGSRKIRMLTPGHIIRGLSSDTSRHRWHSSMLDSPRTMFVEVMKAVCRPLGTRASLASTSFDVGQGSSDQPAQEEAVVKREIVDLVL